MHIRALAGLVSLQQIDAEQVRALQFRVGQELTATIIGLVDDHAVVDLGTGQRLTASVQTAQPVQPGQTMQLVVAEVTPDQVTLRMLPSQALPAQASPSQALAAAGVPDDALNREIVAALIAQSQTITPESVQDLRAAALALQATSPEDVRALAFIAAHDISPTPGLIAVTRQGMADPELGELAGRARELSVKVLAQLPVSGVVVPDLAEGLADLIGKLDAFVQAAPPAALDLPGLLGPVLVSLEHELARILSEGSPDVPPASSEERPSGQSTAGASSVERETLPASTLISPGPVAIGEPDGTGPISGSAAPTAPAVNADSSGDVGNRQPAGQTGARPQTAGRVDGASLPPGEGQGEGAGSRSSGTAGSVRPVDVAPHLNALPEGEEGVRSAPAAPAVAGRLPGTPAAPPNTAPAPLEPPNEALAWRQLPVGSGPLAPPVQPGVEVQAAARRLVHDLDVTLQAGALHDVSRIAASQLRDVLQQYVQSVQFHQLQNLPAGTVGLAGNYFAFPLPLAPGFGAAELRVSYRDEEGARRIDPEDVHLVFQLDLRQLRLVTISLHVQQRRIVCRMEAESPSTERMLNDAAPRLRAGLQQLGYAVEPIRCTLLPPRAANSAPSPHLPSKSSRPTFPGQVNVEV